MHKRTFLLISVLLYRSLFFSQSDSISPGQLQHRKIVLGASTVLVASSSLIALNTIWYKQYKTVNFNFFNDNKEWNQMDKCGHSFTTYQTSRIMMDVFDWAGFSKKQTLWIGGTLGFVYMTAIEVMDGYSQGWGFSWGDELANAIGTSLAMAQRAYWKEQRIQIKFSYLSSGLADFNPDKLGKTPLTRVIKDYNGQTYWLSVNPSTFIKHNDHFPKWLNLAFGYSAYGMLGGSYNNVVAQDNQGKAFIVERQRRFYLSLDIDLTRIRTRSKLLKATFNALNMLKIPAPAIGLIGSKVKFIGLYY